MAMAIISYLHDRKIRTAVTTHYSELKVYALSTEGVENACCEFDVETLRPTYRLLIGPPGKVTLLPFPNVWACGYIIDSAREFISHDEARFEDVITDLEISKKSVAFEQERAEQYRREAESLKKEVERQKEKTREQKEKILQKAREEAKQIYAQAKEEADQIIKEMNREAKQKNQQKALENRAKLKEKLSSVQEDFLKSKKVKPTHKPPEKLQAGDRVYVISFDQNGVALSAPDKNKDVMVQMGIMKVKVPLAELMLDDTPQPKEPKPRQTNVRAKAKKSQFISAEIDCRGQLVDEAIVNIDKYIDDAYLSGLKQIIIIHGKGTGALRAGVQKYLRTNPHVKSQRPGTFGEGVPAYGCRTEVKGEVIRR